MILYAFFEAISSLMRPSSTGPLFVETTLTGRNRTWLADQYFDGGGAYDLGPGAVFTNTDLPTLYQTGRFGEFRYEIPASPATYSIKMHFAEP